MNPKATARDYWRAGRAMFAAGFRAGDLVHNAFSYHMTPGAFIMESGAHAVGCTVFPAGVGQTEQQLQAIAELKPDAYVGTPSFLRILVEKAIETGSDVSSIRKGLTGGEALPPIAARLVHRAWHGRLPELRHGRPGPHRLRNAGARRPGAGRGRDRGDRAPRHRRPGARGRSGRTGRDHAQPRLSAHSFRHRRPVRPAARHLPDRPHQRAHQGMDGPRRPDHQNPRHVRASRRKWPTSPGAFPR